MMACILRGAQCAPLAASIALAILLAGCSGGAEEGTVEINGTVTLDGAPVDGASVAFIGKGGARLATAQTDSAGKFTIRASLGENKVTVAKSDPNAAPPPSSDEPQLMPSDQEYQKIATAKPAFPAKYADPKTSGLNINVVEGMSSVELALTSK